jgi:hypothetical protein
MGDQQESLKLTAIPGFGGYHVSDEGVLYSTKRYTIPRALTPHHHKARGKKKYLRVKLCGKLRLVHRLIACITIGRPLRKGEMVNHLDGDTLNNRIDNLQVVTHEQNVAHAVANGLYCSGNRWREARGFSKIFND